MNRKQKIATILIAALLAVLLLLLFRAESVSDSSIDSTSSPQDRESAPLLHGIPVFTGEGLSSVVESEEKRDVDDQAHLSLSKDEMVLSIIDAITKEPITNASVVWCGPDAAYVDATNCVATSDNEGRASFDRQSLKGTEAEFVLLITASGYVAQSLSQPWTFPVTVLLERGARVSGRVVEQWGDPISGASVDAMARHGGDAMFAVGRQLKRLGPRRALSLASTTTKSDGTFILSGLTSFPVVLRAHKKGYLQFGQPISVKGERGDVQIELYGLARCGVRVIDQATKKLIWVYQTKLKNAVTGGYPPNPNGDDALRTGWDPDSGETWMTVNRGSTPIAAEVDAVVFAPGYEQWNGVLPLRTSAPWSATTVQLRRTSQAFGELPIRVIAPNLPRPMVWADVHIRTANHRIGRMSVPVDKEGRGTLSLPVGTYSVRFYFPMGGMYLWPNRESPPPRNVIIGPGKNEEIAVELKCGIVRIRPVHESGTILNAGFFSIWRGTKAHPWTKKGYGVGGARIQSLLYGDYGWRYRRLFPIVDGRLSFALPAGYYSSQLLIVGEKERQAASEFEIEIGKTVDVDVVLR